jgi:hypothetical protein
MQVQLVALLIEAGLVAATLLLALATLGLVVFAALQAKSMKDAMFLEGALSLWRELETPRARADRRTVYHEAVDVDPQAIAADEKLQERVERVAAGFDYLGRLARIDARLRGLAIEFYGVPAIRSWAVLKPYVMHMISSGLRLRNFHEAFRTFAETAARDNRLRELPGIMGGSEVLVDRGGKETRTYTIWDDD